ncbi:hypothetical protein EZS27_033936 [termite gut metagenome]|uniref:Response regulatory domain-containing protein n=1 Tax=termite gut metagenome TaxID=433724 RepID=A0A5J4Q176_9ZZZZ
MYMPFSDCYAVVEATDGQEALDRIEEINPDLIVSDNLIAKIL